MVLQHIRPDVVINRNIPDIGLNQTTVIFGTIIIAFFVYITVKGELPTYIGFLKGTTASGSTPAGVTSLAADNSVIRGASNLEKEAANLVAKTPNSSISTSQLTPTFPYNPLIEPYAGQ